MRRTAHLAFGAIIAAALLIGTPLWTRWGRMVWLADFAALCG